MKQKFTFEHLLYLTAFLLALAFRFIGLGDVPLSEFEANWAMQAYQLAQAQPVLLEGQAAYVVLTGALFSLFGSSDFLARFMPALIGSLLVVLPWLMRKRIGAVAALVLAFGLALDPGLVAVSRLAGGPMLAVGIVLGLIVAWQMERPVWMGILLGFGLLAGTPFWFGFITLVLAMLLVRAFSSEKISVDRGFLRPMFFAAAVVVFFVGTNFLRFPGGLSALGGGLASFFAGWVQPSGVFIGQSFFALIAYQPLAFGVMLIVWVVATFKGEARASVMLWWVFTALLFIVLYPARQLHDLVWVLIPIWAVAAQGLGQYLESTNFRDTVMGGQAGLTFIFLVFAWLDLAYILSHALVGQDRVVRLWIAAAVVLLTVGSAVLIGLGWSFFSSMRGLAWGTISFLAFYLVGTAWTASHMRGRLPFELWQPSPVAGVNDIFFETISALSEQDMGYDESIEIVSLDDAFAIQWLLRAFPNARYAEQLAPGEQPPLVIAASDAEDVFLQTVYRGQSFALNTHRGWTTTFPPDFLRWFIWREATPVQDMTVLWVRADVFPDGAALPGQVITP